MKFFGGKNSALFDEWTLVHVLSYYFYTGFFFSLFTFWLALTIMLVVSFIWEMIERYLENSSNKWFDEKEIWYNRFVGDPLANTVGFFLSWNYWIF